MKRIRKAITGVAVALALGGAMVATSASPASAHGIHINPCYPGSAVEWWSGTPQVADSPAGGHDWAVINGHLYVYHFGIPVYTEGSWCAV